MGLKLVTGETKRLDLGDGDYLVVDADIGKRELKSILSRIPENTRVATSAGDLTLDGATSLTSALFDVFVKEWSLRDATGEPVPVTQENYLSLNLESVSIVDEALMKHFNELVDVSKEDSKTRSGSRKK